MSRWSRARNVRRDYSRKSFSNPLFEPARGEREIRVRWRRRVLFLAGFAAVGGWVWLTAFSPVFKITEIAVLGADRIPSWEVRDAVTELFKERRWLILPKSSLLVLSEEDVASSLNERFVLESLNVTKRPPHTLAINLKERISAILLQLPDSSQGLVDLEGRVTRLYKTEEALEIVPKLGPSIDEQQGRTSVRYPALYDDKNEKLSLREQVLRPETVQAVIGLPGLFDARFNRAPYLVEMHIDGVGSQTLRAVTSEGWAIYLNVAGNIQEQLENAQTILKNKVGENRAGLEYIDVRFGEKIFFKVK